eukprot:jgi/Bigna1/84664/fgenesh1_pg.198_\
MGRKSKGGNFGADEAIDMAGQLLELWKKGDKQNGKLKSLVKNAKETKTSIKRLMMLVKSINTFSISIHEETWFMQQKGLAKSDLTPKMKAQVLSLDESIKEDMEIVKEWSTAIFVAIVLVLMVVFLIVIFLVYVRSPLVTDTQVYLLVPSLAIYLADMKIGNELIIAGVSLALIGIFRYRTELEQFASTWQGTYDKQYKEMSAIFREYDDQIKEFNETQTQLREARAFDVSAILAEVGLALMRITHIMLFL